MGNFEKECVAPLLAQLEKLKGLKKDWDSYGGEPPTVHAIYTAEQLILRSLSELIVAKNVRPLPNGGAQVEWGSKIDSIKLSLKVEAEVDPTGQKIRYLVIKNYKENKSTKEIQNTSLGGLIAALHKAVKWTDDIAMENIKEIF